MKGQDLINTIIPDEVLIKVFRHLDGQKSDRDSCALVCKRWYRLESASRHTIRIGASDSPDGCIGLLVQRFSDLRCVYMDERLPVSLKQNLRFHLGTGLRSCRNTNAGSSSSRRALKRNHSAEKHGTEEGELESRNLSDLGLNVLGRGCQRLEKLSLIWCSAVTSLGLASVAQHCSVLKALDLQGCYISDQGLTAVGEQCKQLEDLNLRFCEGLTDRGVTAIAIGCAKTLKALGIAACARITDRAMEAVGVHCH